MSKTCICCGKTKELVFFQKRKDSKDGFRNECKVCIKKRMENWTKNGPKKSFKDSEDKKQCRKCLSILSFDNFGKSKQNKDGLKSYCNKCKSIESKQWREKSYNYIKKYREDNREKALEYGAKYRRENRGAILKGMNDWARRNREDLLAKKKTYYKKNREDLLAKKKTYYKKNREKIIKREYMYVKRSVQAKLRRTLRNRMYRALKNESGSGIAIEYLGCSIKQLKHHLESKFLEGMSWDNHGDWHIDHIIPLASFDLTKTAEAKKACHFENLQPLWAEDNLRKSDKL